MTDRDALRSLLIYAEREAQSQKLTVVAQLLSLTIANLANANRKGAGVALDGVTPDGDLQLAQVETYLQ